MTKFVVQVIAREEGNVVKEIKCMSEKQAERVEEGININLNHEKFFTQIKSGE